MKKIFTVIGLSAALFAQAQNIEVTYKDSAFDISWKHTNRLTNGTSLLNNNKAITAGYKISNDVALFWTRPGNDPLTPTTFAGFNFDEAPQFERGVAIWRYKPWNSWTKPIAVKASSQMPEDDVQLYYWQYADGIYGAAVPLSGSGYRTTLGGSGQKWGSKSFSYSQIKKTDSIPAIAIAFGKDPFELFERIYRTSLQYMGKGDNLRVKKKMPEPFNYIGWCSWNASDNGTKLDEDLLINAARSFSSHHFPLGWMLVDDGWFQQDNMKLQSFHQSQQKFPNGFKPVTEKLKKEYGIKYVGVWHTLNGLWNGIDTSSPLGKKYRRSLFSWQQKDDPGSKEPPHNTYYFVKPGQKLNDFFNEWHGYLKQQGFDFVKVDNQLVMERMAVNNYPVFTLSDSVHKALYRSVDKYFNSAIINCMDMTADAYLNFGSSAVARAVEDYFPYEKNENYNLQHGNAAAHVLQAVYNSIYFGQMVYPDFDLFQSHNPNAYYHAIARAINCGPIYITDNIGQQQFEVLEPLVYHDGKIIRSETPLVPTADCMFQVQDNKLFKAWSMTHDAGLLGIWNAADTDQVSGTLRPSDVNDIKGDDFVCYEYFSGELKRMKRSDSIKINLPRMGYKLYYIIPVKNRFGAIGLAGKYNGPATVLKEKWDNRKVSINLYEGGTLKAYCEKKPALVTVNGKKVSSFRFSENLLTVDVPAQSKPVVSIYW